MTDGTNTVSNPYLSQPASSLTTTTTTTRGSAAASASTSQRSKDGAKHETRLYIGHLHPTVDEYTLIHTFSKFGKIAKLDYLFHKSGPQRGQPRGYAFVEYTSSEEAMQAVVGAHDKTLRGRKISVSYASKNADAERDASGGVSGGGAGGPHRRDRRAANDAESSRATQLSLNRNANQPRSTDAKIAAMETRLAQLRQAKAPSTGTTTSQSATRSMQTGLASLPAKPTFRPTEDSTASSKQRRR